jgi:hypothetical protein
MSGFGGKTSVRFREMTRAEGPLLALLLQHRHFYIDANSCRCSANYDGANIDGSSMGVNRDFALKCTC